MKLLWPVLILGIRLTLKLAPRAGLPDLLVIHTLQEVDHRCMRTISVLSSSSAVGLLEFRIFLYLRLFLTGVESLSVVLPGDLLLAVLVWRSASILLCR